VTGPARCWAGSVDDASLDRAVVDGRLLPGDADAVREFRDELRRSAEAALGGVEVEPAEAEPAPKKRRRTRERVKRPDGTEAVMTKPARADLLHYRRHGLVTVLVRRTHDLELARRLAAEKWAEARQDVEIGPLVHHRVGWWQTYFATVTPQGAANDERGRVVVTCTWDRHGSSPGIEWRAAITPTKET